MKKWLTRSAFVLLALVLAAQLIPVDRTNPEAKIEIPAPAEIGVVLERSCYDCHSYQTRWPWYSYVAPVSWFVTQHVHDGRENLNLTAWPLLDNEAQLFYLGEMRKMIENEEMPLRSYLILHRDARLTEDERGTLLEWIDEEVGLLSEPACP